MITLNELTNITRPHKNRKRVGRGVGSKNGRTCGRGEKGAGARSGYKRRWGKEGGNMPLFMKIPARGFSHARFRREFHVINLQQINAVFEDGEEVNVQTLKERGFVSGPTHGIKILGTGDLHKKLKFRVHALSESVRTKLTQAKLSFEIEN